MEVRIATILSLEGAINRMVSMEETQHGKRAVGFLNKVAELDRSYSILRWTDS
jgi:hypothetical protein